jgi:hypothetical protein
MAFMPPVSAIRGTMGRVSSSRRVRAIRLAVAVEPVKATPATRRSAMRAAPISAPPGMSCRTSGGTPAAKARRTAAAAISGV